MAVSPLAALLERLRRTRPPPGAAATVVGVPSRGAEPSAEVEFLFAALDVAQGRADALVAGAREDAAEIEAAARARCDQVAADARSRADLVAARVLAQRRDACEARARNLLDEAARESAQVLARGRERAPAFADALAARLREGAA